MRIVSWNLNSVRSRHRRLRRLVERHRPDVVLLQETKCVDEVFTSLCSFASDAGYAVAHHGRAGTYSWWSYRPGQFEANRGLRIDLVLCSHDLASCIRTVAIDLAERADDDVDEKPSDHAPVIVDLTDGRSGPGNGSSGTAKGRS